MSKKWMIGSLALSIGLISAGGGAMASSTSAGSTAIKKVAVSAPGKEGPATINNLTVKSIIPLVVHARALYFYSNRGGNIFPMETFMYKAQEYRYLSSDIGTKAKLMNYIKKPTLTMQQHIMCRLSFWSITEECRRLMQIWEIY